MAAAIGNLDVDDAAVEGQVVSAVSEVDGKIQVSRRALVAADIPTLAVDKISSLQTCLTVRLIQMHWQMLRPAVRLKTYLRIHISY